MYLGNPREWYSTRRHHAAIIFIQSTVSSSALLDICFEDSIPWTLQDRTEHDESVVHKVHCKSDCSLMNSNAWFEKRREKAQEPIFFPHPGHLDHPHHRTTSWSMEHSAFAITLSLKDPGRRRDIPSSDLRIDCKQRTRLSNCQFCVSLFLSFLPLFPILLHYLA